MFLLLTAFLKNRKLTDGLSLPLPYQRCLWTTSGLQRPEGPAETQEEKGRWSWAATGLEATRWWPEREQQKGTAGRNAWVIFWLLGIHPLGIWGHLLARLKDLAAFFFFLRKNYQGKVIMTIRMPDAHSWSIANRVFDAVEGLWADMAEFGLFFLENVSSYHEIIQTFISKGECVLSSWGGVLRGVP